jgi:RNA polymerase sigma factor (sigma-70 family)
MAQRTQSRDRQTMLALSLPVDADLPAGHGSPARDHDGSPMRAATVAVDRSTSFTQLAEDHLDAAYSLAAVILGDRADAEDATHDAIVKAWRAWPSLRSADAFGAWFQRILVNGCRDRLRRRAHRSRMHSPQSDDGAELQLPSREPDLFARAGDRDALESALNRLNPDERIVVVLRFFADLPIEEIASRVDAPIGTVKSRLHRGISHLRAAYEAAERDPREGHR